MQQASLSLPSIACTRGELPARNLDRDGDITTRCNCRRARASRRLSHGKVSRFVVEGKEPLCLVQESRPLRRALSLNTRAFLMVAIATIANVSAAHADTLITGVTAQATSSQVYGPDVTLNNAGLTETSPGSGVFQLTTNRFADGGCMWNSGNAARQYRYLGPESLCPVQSGRDVYRQAASHSGTITSRATISGASGMSPSNIRGDGIAWKSVAQRFRLRQSARR